MVTARPGRSFWKIRPRRRATPWVAGDERERRELHAGFLRPEVLEPVSRLRPIADELGISMAQLALAWVLREPNVASAIIGASRPEQVDDNVAASSIELDANVLAQIDDVLASALAVIEAG